MAINRLHICQTCTRDGARAEDGRTFGQHLTEQVLKVFNSSSLRDALVIRKVPCLSGCLSPCNVSFRAPGKSSLRFSRMNVVDAADLIQFAAHYVNTGDGEVDPTLWPESLKNNMTARTPAPTK